MACHLSAVAALFGVTARCRLVSLWLGTKQGPISGVTGFLRFTVGMMLKLVLPRLTWRCHGTLVQSAATIAKALSAAGC